MLKLMYTDTGIYLEQLTQPLNAWVEMRLAFAIQVGSSLYVEAGRGSFLLPNTVVLDHKIHEQIEIDRCDEDTLEISLEGLWLSSDGTQHEGILAVELDPELEYHLFQVWQQAVALSLKSTSKAV